MTLLIYTAAAVLTLLAIALIVLPMLRFRSERGIGLALVAVVLVFPLTVLAVYNNVTTYPWGDESIATSQQQISDQPPVEEMITELAARLKEQPDVEGYILLARSYIQLQRFPDAVEAWHRAWELTEGKSPQVSLGYAEALILADQRTLKTSAADLLEFALEELPDDPRALWYGGVSAAARGMNDLAIERYGKLLQDETLPDNMRMVVQEQMAKLGGSVAEIPAADKAAVEEGGGTGPVLTIRVELDPAIIDRVSPDATLFLFARDAGQAGPPLAVRRMRQQNFPVETTLSNDNAMVAGRTLESARQLEVVARLTSSGSAIESAGDLYGKATPQMDGRGADVTIRIDSIAE